MKLANLRPPQLRTADEDSHRAATWLELFYDLVFVVAVAGLGHRLLVDPSWKGGLAFVGLFIPLWWTWAGYTFYADRYDTDDLGQRNLAAAQIMAVAFMAASVGGEETDSSFAFGWRSSAPASLLVTMYCGPIATSPRDPRARHRLRHRDVGRNRRLGRLAAGTRGGRGSSSGRIGLVDRLLQHLPAPQDPGQGAALQLRTSRSGSGSSPSWCSANRSPRWLPASSMRAGDDAVHRRHPRHRHRHRLVVALLRQSGGRGGAAP